VSNTSHGYHTSGTVLLNEWEHPGNGSGGSITIHGPYNPNGWPYRCAPYIDHYPGTITLTPAEPRVSLKSKQYAVVAVGTNQVVGAHDDEAEAVSHASRLAAKHDGEYLVLKPVRLLRQKPVDIEDLPL
jgi:hypothetical protein